MTMVVMDIPWVYLVGHIYRRKLDSNMTQLECVGSVRSRLCIYIHRKNNVLIECSIYRMISLRVLFVSFLKVLLSYTFNSFFNIKMLRWLRVVPSDNRSVDDGIQKNKIIQIYHRSFSSFYHFSDHVAYVIVPSTLLLLWTHLWVFRY
jgi:hypothetical protein